MVVGYGGGGGTHSKRGEEWVWRPGGGAFLSFPAGNPPPSCGAHIKGEREKEKRGDWWRYALRYMYRKGERSSLPDGHGNV